MEAIKETVFRLFTTPKELRSIADNMEETYPKLLLGDSVITTRKIVKSSDSQIWRIEFAADQEKMEKQK